MTSNRVLQILFEKEIVDGETISKKLGVSRATVNRIISSLREQGYPIVAIPGKGYSLLEDDLSVLPRVLGDTVWMKTHEYYYVEECSSTQDVARELTSLGLKGNLVVVAERMWGGRGRLGRKWIADKGGLWFTITYKPGSMVGMQLITLAAGLSVAKSLRALYGIEAMLKWPNDVIVGEKKLSGILVEAIAEADRTNFLFVGVGINVNNKASKLGVNGISISEILGRKVYRTPLLFSVTEMLDHYFSDILLGSSASIIEEWRSLSATIGKEIVVETYEGKYKGFALDVMDDGCLMIEVKGGLIKKICSGDVYHIR